jgi:hypothetical protein
MPPNSLIFSWIDQEFGEQLGGMPNVKRIVLRRIYQGFVRNLPPNFGMTGLNLLEALETTSCYLGVYFNPLLTSGRLTSLTIDFPWNADRTSPLEELPNSLLSKLVKLKLKLLGFTQEERHLVIESSRYILSLLGRACSLEMVEFADADLGFLDTILQGFLANANGTLLCPRLRNIRLSNGVVMFPSILIRLLGRRSSS